MTSAKPMPGITKVVSQSAKGFSRPNRSFNASSAKTLLGASGFTPSFLSLAAAEIVGPSISARGVGMLGPSIDTNFVVIHGLCAEELAYVGMGLRGGGR